MKALLSIHCGCILAAISPGRCQAAPSDTDLPKPEVALNAPDSGSALPAPTESAAASPVPSKITSAPRARAPSAPASQNVTINLINRRVQRGVLTKEDTDELIKQAEADAVKAREQTGAANRPQAEQPPAPDASLFQPGVPAPPANVIAPPPAGPPPAGDSSDEVRVPYIPEVVRRQIAEEVREEVMQKAENENWVNPRTLPSWILRLTPFADFRIRYEGPFFSSTRPSKFSSEDKSLLAAQVGGNFTWDRDFSARVAGAYYVFEHIAGRLSSPSFHLSLFGEFVQNVAFDGGHVNAIAVNNRGPDRADGKPGSFAGGDTGWILGLKAGTPAFEKRWDWNVGASYRYLESDATVDGFNDSDFGLGGTNLKGYTLFGAVALSKPISFYRRWMSANEVAGPTFRNDTIQFDFNAKF